MREIEQIVVQICAADTDGPGLALEQRVNTELYLYRRITEALGNKYYGEVITMIETNIQSNLRSAFLKNAALSKFGPKIIVEHAAVQREPVRHRRVARGVFAEGFRLGKVGVEHAWIGAQGCGATGSHHRAALHDIGVVAATKRDLRILLDQ